jgi:hypothetical protein
VDKGGHNGGALHCELLALNGIRRLPNASVPDARRGHVNPQGFAARTQKMPLTQGTENVEEQLNERIESATGQEVVGLLVRW